MNIFKKNVVVAMNKSLPEQFFKDLNTLVSIDSKLEEDKSTEETPFGPGPRAALEAMKAIALRDGLPVIDANHKALSCTFDVGSSFNFGCLGHLDIVPAVGQWRHNPFEVSIEDGKMYGRGVLDDKGPLLAAYYAAKEAQAEGLLKDNIVFIMGCDEENDSRGVKEYLKHYPAPDASVSPDADFPVIIGEKGITSIDLVGQEKPVVKSIICDNKYNLVPECATVTLYPEQKDLIDLAKGYATKFGLGFESDELSFTFLGVAHHAMEPEQGLNALAHVLSFLYHHVHSPFLDELNEKVVFDFYGIKTGCSYHDDVMGDVTVNLANMHYNQEGYQVGFNVRVPLSENYTCVDTAFNAFKTARCVIKKRSYGLYKPEDTPIAQICLESYRTITQDYSKPLTMGGGTYAREVPNALAFGPLKPQSINTCHMTDEWIMIKDLEDMYNIYLYLFTHTDKLH